MNSLTGRLRLRQTVTVFHSEDLNITHTHCTRTNISNQFEAHKHFLYYYYCTQTHCLKTFQSNHLFPMNNSTHTHTHTSREGSVHPGGSSWHSWNNGQKTTYKYWIWN